MKVALSTDVQCDGSTFEFAVPSEVETRFAPVSASLFSAGAEVAAHLNNNDNPEAVSTAKAMAEAMVSRLSQNTQDAIAEADASGDLRTMIGLNLLNAPTLDLFVEVFEKGVVAWSDVTFRDGAKLTFSNDHKTKFPLYPKLSVAILYALQQAACLDLGGSAT